MTYLTGELLFVIAIEAAAIVTLLFLGTRLRRAARALREREEHFRLVADRAPVIIWTARPDTTLDYVNGTCADFTGLPIEKLLNEGWLDTVHPEDRDRAVATYTPAVEARRPFHFEYRVLRADGIYRWLLASGVPRYELGGAYAGYVGCDVDITERKQAEELMRESQAEVQQLADRLFTAREDERRHLARELHDDLTQRIARLAIDAGRIELDLGVNAGIATVMRQELVRLSEDVHALSYRLHPTVLDDLGLLEALRTECERVARDARLSVDVEAHGVPQALPMEISLCLFRVAQEALSNAARHASASVVKVQLSPSDSGLRLAVRDDGSGFDFERSQKRASLGLASMHERVRLMHGRLDIESAPGRGTTVVAWVPA